jgi:hypothetical protein
MGLFDQVIGAINNSDRAGSSGQLATILSTVQQLSNSYGTNPSTMQSLLSLVGSQVRSSLQQQRTANGEEQAQAIVDRYSGTYPNPQALHTLFSPNQQEHLAQTAAQQTGLNIGTIQQMLPILVPLVLNLLQTGSRNQNFQRGGNPVLNAFLDADRDGDVDIADVMNLAGRHLGR